MHHLKTVHSDVPTGAFKKISNSTGTDNENYCTSEVNMFEEDTTIYNKQEQNKVLVTKINKQSETKVSDKMTRPKVGFFIKDQEGSIIANKPIQVQIIEDAVQIDQCYMCGTKWKTNEIRSHFCHEHGRYPGGEIFHGPEEREDQCPKCKFFLAESIQDTVNHVCIEYFARKAKPGEGPKNKDQQCSECGKVFKGYSLIKHMKYAHGKNDKLFECIKCNYKTKTGFLLSKHTKYVHEKSRPYACDQCEKVFREKWIMKNHIKAVHEGIKPYKCENCGKGFNNRNSHERHNCPEYIIKVKASEVPSNSELASIEDPNDPTDPNDPNDPDGKNDTSDPNDDIGPFDLNDVNDPNDFNHPNDDKIVAEASVAAAEELDNKVIGLCRPNIPQAMQKIKSPEKQKSLEDSLNKDGGFDNKVSLAKPRMAKKRKPSWTVSSDLLDGLDETKYICYYCVKMFLNRKFLHEHFKRHLDANGNFPCKHCNVVQPSFRKISMHNHRSHNPGFCKVCNKSFHSQTSLARHKQAIHGNKSIKKFKCELCPYVTHTGPYLYEHRTRMHGKLAVKPME